MQNAKENVYYTLHIKILLKLCKFYVPFEKLDVIPGV